MALKVFVHGFAIIFWEILLGVDLEYIQLPKGPESDRSLSDFCIHWRLLLEVIVKPGSGRGNFVRGVFREGPKEIKVFSRRAKNNLMACRRASLGRRARLGAVWFSWRGNEKTRVFSRRANHTEAPLF